MNRFGNGICLQRWRFVFRGERNGRTEEFAERTGVFVFGRLFGDCDMVIEEVPMQSGCGNERKQIQSEHGAGDELIESALGHCLVLVSVG